MPSCVCYMPGSLALAMSEVLFALKKKTLAAQRVFQRIPFVSNMWLLEGKDADFPCQRDVSTAR